MRKALLILGLSGCASTNPALEARVNELEKQLAALRAAPPNGVNQTDHFGSQQCEASIDVSLSQTTDYPNPVPFELGKTKFQAGDVITINQVEGTRPQFEKFGVYRVRGTYTLATADEAELGFSVTATQRGQGCTRNGAGGSKKITRGSGTFELTTPIPYEGYPHVSLYVDGSDHGGVYFGKGDFLNK